MRSGRAAEWASGRVDESRGFSPRPLAHLPARPLFLALLFLLFTNALLASGSLSGRVTSAGKPLANAAVSASTESMPKPFETMTSANGTYALPAIPAGTYDVTFSLAGHQTLTRRAEVRSFERARIDAELEVTEEEESVTQTAMARDVNERPQSAWTLDRVTADKLAIGRPLGPRVLLAPETLDLAVHVDDLESLHGLAIPSQAIDDTSVLFAGAGAEHSGPRVEVTTRGKRDFSAALRDTITWNDGDASQVQGASIGGLWMFAAVNRSDESRAGFAKGTLAPTAHDTATLSFFGTTLFTDEELRGMWLHVAPRATLLADIVNDDFAALRGYAFAAGAHELGAGVERRLGENAAYVRDRWSASDRLIVEGGLRVEDDELLPRAGLVFGGTTRFIATYARYANLGDEGAVGVATRVLTSGYARALLVRREHETIGVIDGFARWLLFTFGASAHLQTGNSAANAFVIIDPPLPGHELSIALLERYRAGTATTDVSANYTWPRERLTPFAEVEVANVFDRNDGRLFRLSLGLRM